MSGQPFPPHSLRVSGLAVARDGRTLLDEISFTVGPGGVLLVRGPNGAGKSSLLLTLAGILRPGAGTIDFGAGDEHAGEALHFLGHLNAVKPRLTLAENLRFWMALYQGSGPEPGPAVSGALAIVGLGGLDDHDAGHLSQGQTRRLALARLIAIRRPLWLLDEPTAALDTGGETLVAHLIEDHRAAGGLAVIATHQDIALADPQALTLGSA
jgi:heme exporter protein A